MYVDKNLNIYLHAGFLFFFFKRFSATTKKSFCIWNGAPEAQGKSENSCVLLCMSAGINEWVSSLFVGFCSVVLWSTSLCKLGPNGALHHKPLHLIVQLKLLQPNYTPFAPKDKLRLWVSFYFMLP